MNPFEVIKPSFGRHLTHAIQVVAMLLVLLSSHSSCRGLFAPPGLTADDAFNATYDSEWTSSGSLTLLDGSFSGHPESGSLESRLRVELEAFALGDIDGKAGSDAASILVSTVGTQRKYYEMHVLVEHEGEAVNTGSVFLGDRVRLDCLIIEKPGITLRWFTREAQLGLNGQPYAPQSRYFKIQDGRLTAVEAL